MCNVGSSTTIQLQLLYFSDDFVFHYESFQRLFIHSRSYQVDLFAPFTKIGSSKDCQPAAWGFSLLRRSSQPALSPKSFLTFIGGIYSEYEITVSRAVLYHPCQAKEELRYPSPFPIAKA